MGIKFSELPVLEIDELEGADSFAVLDASEGVLKRANLDIPLSTQHGGTGNEEGYIRTGAKNMSSAGANATVEGRFNEARGDASHAEGDGNTTYGFAAHVEGHQNSAEGDYSHAEGHETKALGHYSHAGGHGTTAQGDGSIALGEGSQAIGVGSIALGKNCIADGDYSVVIGKNCASTYERDVIFGLGNTTSNMFDAEAFVVGRYNLDSDMSFLFDIPLFMVGNGISDEDRSYAFYVSSSGTIFADACDISTMYAESLTLAQNATVRGDIFVEGGVYAYASDIEEYVKVNPVAANYGTPTEELTSLRIGSTTYSVSGGGGLPSDPLSIDHGGTGNSAGYIQTGKLAGTTIGSNATAEGSGTTSSASCTHAEGRDTKATYECSHAEGRSTEASGDCSHAEGSGSKAGGFYSHAEGAGCTTGNWASHAEGYYTSASSDYAHSEGEYTTASGTAAHAQGSYTVAAMYAHSGGQRTKSQQYSFVQGRGSSQDSLLEAPQFSFLFGDKGSNKFTENSALTSPGTCFGASFNNRSFNRGSSYSAQYGISGTVKIDNYGSSAIQVKLNSMDAGSIYLANIVFYETDGTTAGYETAVICPGCGAGTVYYTHYILGRGGRVTTEIDILSSGTGEIAVNCNLISTIDSSKLMPVQISVVRLS